MKNLFLIMLLFATTLSFASFPVNTANANNASADTEEVKSVENLSSETINLEESNLTPVNSTAAYDKWVAVALWFFLGWPFAAHRWYAKKPVLPNILFIVTFAGLGIWGLIDLINILTDNF